ncbi:MAG: amidohydrolase [Cytophagales bacterium]
MKDIIKHRKHLHQHPELSGREYKTADYISNAMKSYAPDEEIKLAETGRAFVFNGDQEGPTVLFRAELDALPINEEDNLEYKSKNPGIAHSCGHDGHMAILLALAKLISEKRPKKGRIIILFQPAEETGQGAKNVIADKAFSKIKPDFAFSLHNIPGRPKHSIIIKDRSFASASKGLTLKLFGKTSHAAEPENGINPSVAISKIILQLDDILNASVYEKLVLITIVNIHVGEIAFGTSAGYGELRMTLRAFRDGDMKILTEKTEALIKSIAKDEGLQSDIAYSEVFPATTNNDDCLEIIKNAAEFYNLSLIERSEPFKWSEDFGYFSEICHCGFFGLGSGENQPSLHNPDYDFPDEIIETGAKMFLKISENYNY